MVACLPPELFAAGADEEQAASVTTAATTSTWTQTTDSRISRIASPFAKGYCIAHATATYVRHGVGHAVWRHFRHARTRSPRFGKTLRCALPSLVVRRTTAARSTVDR